jgi:hypothetical protein
MADGGLEEAECSRDLRSTLTCLRATWYTGNVCPDMVRDGPGGLYEKLGQVRCVSRDSAITASSEL